MVPIFFTDIFKILKQLNIFGCLKLVPFEKNIAKSEQSSHAPAVAIRGHTTLIGKNNLSFVVPNFKILGQVVPEKYLTKIFIFITLE